MIKKILKYRIFLLPLLPILFINSCSYFHTDSSQIKTEAPFFKAKPGLENKGKYATSIGELRTLVLYVTFADDSGIQSDSWKFSTTQLPEWGIDLINSSTKLEFTKNNLTQYFHEMSFGNLMLYGDVYPKLIVPLHDQKYYKSISDVNHEILSNLDGEIDFSKYDNWTKTNDGKYINEPDGQVDLIFLIYRNFENHLYFNNSWTGIAHLYLTKDIITNDGVVIKTGRLDKGSGIQTRGGKAGFDYTKYTLAHEFGHLLFGAGHLLNAANLTLMTGTPVWNASRGMMSWEREKLGWINFIDVSNNSNSKITLADYMTTGEAYRIKLNNNEWFILENRQRESIHDRARDSGLYIYHIKNAHKFAPSVAVECADGNWDFNINKTNKNLVRTTPNQSGKNELSFRKTIEGENYFCYDKVYEDNSAWGDEFDAFDPTYNNLFSPMSNPSSKNNSKIDFAIEVKNKEGNKYLVEIYFDEIYQNTPPSKTQIIGVEQDISDKYLLKWLRNLEPDLFGYYIYISEIQLNRQRKTSKIKVNKNSNPTEYNISSYLKLKKTKYNFRLTALDKSGKESVKSDAIELSYDIPNKNWKWERIEE